MKINIANGSLFEIHCRVQSERINVVSSQGDIGFSSAFLGLRGQVHRQFEHQTTGGLGSTPIWSGNSLAFSAKGSLVYMSIVSDRGYVCSNHEVWKGGNFIVSRGLHLKNAKKGSLWVDKDNRDHEIEEQFKTCSVFVSTLKDCSNTIRGIVIRKRISNSL